MESKLKVGFICVHNSCRSQIAEAISKIKTNTTFESFSAGTEAGNYINKDAIRLMKKLYKIDISKQQYSKSINEIPKLDIVITMGCNVECPWLPSRYREDWGLDDPTGKSDDFFINIINKIEKKILELENRIRNNEIPM